MQTRIHLKPVFAAFGIALVSLLAPNPAANPVALAATTYVVNDGGVDCSSFTATHTSIQTAVTNAVTNNVKTILVCPGSYSNFLVSGAKTLTIKAAYPGTFPTINAPVSSSGIIIDVQLSSGVVLDGLRIDGENFDDALTFQTYGIYFYDSSGTVQNSSITRVRCYPSTCSRGVGIYVQDDDEDGKVSTLTVKNTNVSDVDSFGIWAQGPTKLTVSGTQVTGNFSGGAGVFP